MFSAYEIKTLTKKSLQDIKVGTGEAELQNGKDFYKFFFTNFGDLRVYFKGAENYTAEDVQKSERFEKQGQRLLVALHVLVNTYDDAMTFKAYTRDIVSRHRQFKLDPPLWDAFFSVWIAFLETKSTVDDATKNAWHELGKAFSTEALDYLKNQGLPH